MIESHNQNIRTNSLDPEILRIPFRIKTNWHVITGAPCCGKTTLIKLLTSKGYKTIREVGRKFIEGETARGKTLEEIRENDIDFDYAIKNLTFKVESELNPEDILFLDRALPDSLAFFRLAGLDPNTILPECFMHHYASVFILDRFPVQPDDARIEDEGTAILIDEWLMRDYSALGYEVKRVPVLPPEERVEYLISKIPGLYLKF